MKGFGRVLYLLPDINFNGFTPMKDGCIEAGAISRHWTLLNLMNLALWLIIYIVLVSFLCMPLQSQQLTLHFLELVHI